MPIQKPDLAERRKAIRIFAGILLCLIILSVIILLNPELTTQIRDYFIAQFVESPQLIVIYGLIASIPIFIFSTYLFLMGNRIASQQRFPLPGQKVIRETKILEGNAAIRNGRIIQLIAFILFGASVALPLVLGHLVQVFTNAP